MQCVPLSIANRGKLLVTMEFVSASNNVMWAFKDSLEIYPIQLCTGSRRNCVEENTTLNQTEFLFHGTFQKREKTQQHGAICRTLTAMCTQTCVLHALPTFPADPKYFLYPIPRFLHGPRSRRQVKGSTALPLLNDPREMLLQNYLPLELIRRMSSERTPGLVTSIPTTSKSRDMQQTAFQIIMENPLAFLPQLMQGLLEVWHNF